MNAGSAQPIAEDRPATTVIPQWSEEFETGIKAIDADHRGLFEEFGVIADTLVTERSSQRIDQTITCLENYIADHFHREEMFMVSAGYPNAEAHIRTHRTLSRKVRCLREIHRSGIAPIDSVKLATFLSNWLTDHILTVDMDYVPYLRGRARGRDRGLAKRVHEVNVLVPESHRSTVDAFLRIIQSDSPLSKEFVALVEQFEQRLHDAELEAAKDLFCTSD